MKRILFLFVLVIALISFASADTDPTLTYTQGQPFNITHSVRVDGAPSSTVLCNITVFSPRTNTIIVPYQKMNFNTGSKTFSYLLNSTQTATIGNLCYDITCLDTTTLLNDTESFCPEITQTGTLYTIPQSITYIFMLVLALTLFLLCVYTSTRINTENSVDEFGAILGVNKNKHIRNALIVFSYLILMWLFYVTYNITLGFLELAAISNFFWAAFKVMLAAMKPMFVFYVIFTFAIWLRDRSLEKKLKMGLTIKQ